MEVFHQNYVSHVIQHVLLAMIVHKLQILVSHVKVQVNILHMLLIKVMVLVLLHAKVIYFDNIIQLFYFIFYFFYNISKLLYR